VECNDTISRNCTALRQRFDRPQVVPRLAKVEFEQQHAADDLRSPTSRTIWARTAKVDCSLL